MNRLQYSEFFFDFYCSGFFLAIHHHCKIKQIPIGPTMKVSLVFGLFFITLLQKVALAFDIPDHYYSRVVKNARDRLLLSRCMDRQTGMYYSEGYTPVQDNGKCEMVFCDLERYKLNVKGYVIIKKFSTSKSHSRPNS